jgi:hypothetical protein
MGKTLCAQCVWLEVDRVSVRARRRRRDLRNMFSANSESSLPKVKNPQETRPSGSVEYKYRRNTPKQVRGNEIL